MKTQFVTSGLFPKSEIAGYLGISSWWRHAYLAKTSFDCWPPIFRILDIGRSFLILIKIGYAYSWKWYIPDQIKESDLSGNMAFPDQNSGRFILTYYWMAARYLHWTCQSRLKAMWGTGRGRTSQHGNGTARRWWLKGSDKEIQRDEMEDRIIRLADIWTKNNFRGTGYREIGRERQRVRLTTN